MERELDPCSFAFDFEPRELPDSELYFERFNFKYLNSHIKPFKQEPFELSDTEASNEKRLSTPDSKYKYIYQIMNSASEHKTQRSGQIGNSRQKGGLSSSNCVTRLFDSCENAVKKPKRSVKLNRKTLTPASRQRFRRGRHRARRAPKPGRG